MFNYVNEGRHRPFQFSFITGEWIFFLALLNLMLIIP